MTLKQFAAKAGFFGVIGSLVILLGGMFLGVENYHRQFAQEKDHQQLAQHFGKYLRERNLDDLLNRRARLERWLDEILYRIQRDKRPPSERERSRIRELNSQIRDINERLRRMNGGRPR